MGYRLREPRKGKAWIYWLTFIIIATPAMLWADVKTWIVFDSNRPNPKTTKLTFWDIWKLDPDGSGSEGSNLFGSPLTADTCNEWDPTYSEEVKSVVFVSDKDGWPHLYKVSIDANPTPSSPFTPVTPAGFENCATVDPCYNFQGTLIAFTSNKTGTWHIYTMKPDGSGINMITQGFSDNRSPCFSKDGDKIFFISNRDVPQGGWTQGDWEIYVVNSAGGIPTKAIVQTNGSSWLMDNTERDPACSYGDPNIIIFASNKDKNVYTDEGIVNTASRINFELWKYDLSDPETPPVQLTQSWDEYKKDVDYDGELEDVPELWNSTMPCFSPDGQRIAWSADNWTDVGWPQKPNPMEPPFEPSYWKPANPGNGHGASHQIWIRGLNHTDHHYWFSPSTWGYVSGLDPTPYDAAGHQHHKHYNPSWDYQPGHRP